MILILSLLSQQKLQKEAREPAQMLDSRTYIVLYQVLLRSQFSRFTKCNFRISYPSALIPSLNFPVKSRIPGVLESYLHNLQLSKFTLFLGFHGFSFNKFIQFFCFHMHFLLAQMSVNVHCRCNACVTHQCLTGFYIHSSLIT